MHPLIALGSTAHLAWPSVADSPSWTLSRVSARDGLIDGCARFLASLHDVSPYRKDFWLA
ncbi:MAG: hypothetical protein QOC89_2780 [Paraburkholderia sp.]|jgi:hypothetical protein|nr:hypothetical protein [Paraburkholderia sp.]